MTMLARSRRLSLAVASLAAPMLVATAAPAAPVAASDKSWLVGWIEREISTPDRKIALGEVDGVLSSNVSISSISVADRQGVWLTINGAHLVWNRAALLTGELSIDTLEASSIVVARAPSASIEVAASKSTPALPSLPVSIKLGKLSVPKISLPASIVGADTDLALDAGGSYDNKTLHATASATRIDSIGGAIRLKADYVPTTGNLGLDLDYHEPQGGIIAKLLGVPGEPPLSFAIKGNGPLDTFAADIALAANDHPLLAGKSTISHGTNGYAFALDVSGSLESLATPTSADFLRGGSAISLHAAQTSGGGYDLSQFTFKSGALNLAGTGQFASDGFPTALNLNGTMDASSGQPLHLPGSDATLVGGQFALAFGDGAWRASLAASDFTSAKVSVAKLDIAAVGRAANLSDAASRTTTFAAQGTAAGITSSDKALADALESQLHFQLDGRWHAGQPIDVAMAKLSNKALAVAFVGSVDGLELSGDTHLVSTDLSELSGLAGTPLKGSVDVDLKGPLSASTGAFDLTVSGESDALAAGPATFHPLTALKTTLAGHVVRDVNGLHLQHVRLGNANISAEMDGDVGLQSTHLTAAAALSDLAKVTDRASGPIDLTASLTGPTTASAFQLDATSPKLVLQGQQWTDAAIRASGTLGEGAVAADITLGGILYGKPLTGHTHLAENSDGSKQVSGLALNIGDAAITADIAVAVDGLIAGSLKADIPKMQQVAPLLLTKATGSVRLKADLSAAGGTQNAAVNAVVNGVNIETVAVGSGQINLALSDIYKTPAANGIIDLRALTVGSFSVSTANVTMKLQGAKTTFAATAQTSEGPVSTSGSLTPVDDGFDVTIAALKAALHDASVTLKAPVTIEKRGGDLAVHGATLLLPQSGSVTVDGSLGDKLALTLVATKIPMALADAASKGLGATGTLSGTIALTGTREAPEAKFDLHGTGLSIASIRGAGVPAFSLSATGTGDGGALKLDAKLAGGDTTLTAVGSIPYEGVGLDVAVKGTSSLALANLALRDRGASATGRVTADLTVTGTIAKPEARGRIAVTGGSLSDPETENRLSGVEAVLRLDGDRLTIERATATTNASGTVSAAGSIALSGDHAADIRVTMAGASVVDESLLKATLSGDMRISGPVTAAPHVSGSIVVNRADMTIPERFSSNLKLLGVHDRNAPPAVTRTNALADRTVAKKGRGKPFGATVELTVSAPSMIFVRGRGVDAELGGSLRLTGTMAAIHPTGAFKLSHGSIDVIGKHITFDRGEVTLTGNFDPTIDFAASSRTSSITVTAAVTGSAFDPQLKLTSNPELPQDEILAEFLFGHSIADLTSLQLVQLGTAAAQLAGGSSNGDLLSSLRNSTGLDSLGTTTDSSGNIALQAGRNISEHVYLGVTTGVDGQTEGTVNYDVTPNIKLLGQAGTDESKVGIAYQRDY